MAGLKLGIVTVYYNRAKEVRRTLQSLLEIDFPKGDFEILAVDDGSTDNTLEELRAFEGGSVKIVTKANRGFANAIADALANLDVEYVAICGSGDRVHPTRFKKQIEVLTSHPDYVLCGTASQNIDPQTGVTVDVQRFRGGELTASDFLCSPPFTHGSALFRKSAYDKVGGYDRRFTYSQDWDLWLRLTSIGKAFFIDEVLYTRYLLADGASLNPKKAERQIYFKHLALHLHQAMQRDRERLVTESLSNPDSSPFYRRIRNDLCARYVKLVLNGANEDAHALKEIIDNNYSGLNLEARASQRVAAALSSLGFPRKELRRLARRLLSMKRAMKK